MAKPRPGILNCNVCPAYLRHNQQNASKKPVTLVMDSKGTQYRGNELRFTAPPWFAFNDNMTSVWVETDAAVILDGERIEPI